MSLKKEIPSTKTSDIVNIRELRAGVEHQFQVTASLEINGRVFEQEKSVPSIRVFGKAQFFFIMWMHAHCQLTTARFFICISFSQMRQFSNFKLDL